jgi:molecular chaperone GrpE
VTEKNEEIKNQDEDSAQTKASHESEQAGAENSEVCFQPEDVERLLAAIADKNRIQEETTDRLKRLQADFDNFRRRTRQEKEDISKTVTEGVVVQVLPILDNLERALATAGTQDTAAILAGVEMIYRQFSQALEKMGVKPVEAIGQTFDPQCHEAVLRVEDADQPDNTIVEELQKGYMVNGRVVRPSMVKVVGNS